MNPLEFAEEVLKEADQYNGFNLIVADLRSQTMVYVTNRQKEDEKVVIDVLPGVHVLTNARLDSPWPKVRTYVFPLVYKITIPWIPLPNQLCDITNSVYNECIGRNLNSFSFSFPLH